MDRHVHSAFAARQHELLYDISKGAHLGDPRPVVALSCAVLALALLTAGLRAGLRVAAVLVLANVTTVVLAAGVSVARPPFHDPHLWPSNHTTAVAAVGLCLPLIARRRLVIPAAVVAFGMTAGIAVTLILRGTHLLSDLVAGQLVAGFWAVLAAHKGRRLKMGRGSSLITSMTQRRKPGT